MTKKTKILTGIVILFLLTALLSSFLSPYDPAAQDLSSALQAPSLMHWFGTDRFGRDVLSRVLTGGRTTIFVSLGILVLSSSFGTLYGMISGWAGKTVDRILMRICDVFLAFPSMVFAIGIAGILGGGLRNAFLVLCLVSWSKYARLARSETMTVKKEPWIDAARLAGCSDLKILITHVLPFLFNTILNTAMMDMAVIMIELASLSFLGLGVNPPSAEWGAMMNDGRSMIQMYPWTILAPGAAIVITAALFYEAGESLQSERRKHV